MNDISIKFIGFWPTFDPENNKFTDALRTKRRVSVLPPGSNDKPDILFYTCMGDNATHFCYADSIKIYFTGENDVPDFNECDYAISFYDIDFCGRSLRYPLYNLYETDLLQSPPVPTDAEALGRDFCSLLMRNSKNCDPMRLKIIDAVDAYHPIAYGGPYRNNTGGPVAEKIPFIARYKFNLALENSLAPGYVTEKLLEPLAAATVPLYWGCDEAAADFNPDAFVNIRDYDSIDSFIGALSRIDHDPEAYLAILRAPNLRGDCGLDFDSRLADFLNRIADNPRKFVVGHGMMRNFNDRNRVCKKLWDNKILNKAARFIDKII